MPDQGPLTSIRRDNVPSRPPRPTWNSRSDSRPTTVLDNWFSGADGLGERAGHVLRDTIGRGSDVTKTVCNEAAAAVDAHRAGEIGNVARDGGMTSHPLHG